MERSLQDRAAAQGLVIAPAAIKRAVRSSHGMLGIIIRAVAMELYENHLHLRWWGDQYFPDTAEQEYLLRHCGIWGIIRRPATKAIGKATVEGVPGTGIAAGLQLQGTGDTLYEVLTAATIGASGTARLDLRAVTAGSAGNAAADLPLSFTTLVAGLTEQVAAVDAEGLAGGAEIESWASLLARLLEKIREPAHGGAAFDYPVWVQNTFAASQVRTLESWVGKGSVGVCVAMGSALLPRVPTTSELEAIGAHLAAVRPVTAQVVPVAVALMPVDHAIILDPYEAKVREAGEAALRAFYAREARIGEKLYRSRLSEAISAAAGEYRHELVSPSADIAPALLTQLPVPGSITMEPPP